jgi:hypothetical protein
MATQEILGQIYVVLGDVFTEHSVEDLAKTPFFVNFVVRLFPSLGSRLCSFPFFLTASAWQLFPRNFKGINIMQWVLVHALDALSTSIVVCRTAPVLPFAFRVVLFLLFV